MDISPKQFLHGLVEENVINQDTANQYEFDIIQKGINVEEYLKQNTQLQRSSILRVKAKLLNVESIDVRHIAVDPQALNLVSENLAKKNNILPYKYDAGTNSLYIATTNPNDIKLQEFLELRTQKRVYFALADSQDIANSISSSYQQSISPDVSAAVQESNRPAIQQQTNQPSDPANAPVAKIVGTILEFATKSRASDVHIEPEENHTRVRYRVDGYLSEKLTLPTTIHSSVIARIKILADMKIDEHRLPQDGRFDYGIGNEEVDIRVSTMPTVHGEKIVLRLLRKTGGIPSLDELGLDGNNLRKLENLIHKPNGMILVTGPTGSGKTTTLYSILSRLNKKNVNIITLEDPVEYQIPGINQVQINPQAGLTFSSGLRSILRQDPNIVLVGEIRDRETTQLAIQAALTGHLVFSTLHTNDAASAIPRLIDLGGEPFLISSVLQGVIGQRIVRRVSDTCKEEYLPDETQQQHVRDVLGSILPQNSQINLYRPKETDECKENGYYGRVGIFEVLSASDSISKLIFDSSSRNKILEQALQEGFVTMKQDGYLKALNGITTIEEIIRAAEM